MVFVLTAFVIMIVVLAAKNEMSNCRYQALSAMLLLSTLFTTSNAAAQELSGEEINTNLLGHVFNGEYPSGVGWSEQFQVDGSTQYQEGGRTFWGAMSIIGNRVCFTYGPQSGVSGGCFEVWKRSANCFDFYGITGGASNQTSASRVQKMTGQGWSARAWNQKLSATCVADAIS